MATTKPRITITLEPHIYRTLQRASSANGQPMSEIVGNLLTVVQPTLEHMASTFERVQAAAAERTALMVEALAEAQATAEKVLSVPPGQIEIHLVDVSQPPYLTGGSGTGKRARKTATKTVRRSAK